MTSHIDAPRGADLSVAFVFPAGTDLSAYVSTLTIYHDLNGSTLLTVSSAPTGNGSVTGVDMSDATAPKLTLMVKRADIEALPVNADDATQPSILWFDYVTNPSVTPTKLFGGSFRVWPHGSKASLPTTATPFVVNGASPDISVITTGAQGFKGDPGGTTMSVGLYTSLSALNIPLGTDRIETSGYGAKGLGSGRYCIVAESDAAAAAAGYTENQYTARTLNGRWFILNEPMPFPEMFGALGDGIYDYATDHYYSASSTDDGPAINAGIAYCGQTANMATSPMGPSSKYKCGSLWGAAGKIYHIDTPVNPTNLAQWTLEFTNSTIASGSIGSSASGGFLYKISDCIDTQTRCNFEGNSNLPDGIIIENNHAHTRVPGAAMARNDIINCRMGALRQGPSFMNCVRVTDTALVMDNNSENQFRGCRFMSYVFTGISFETANSLNNHIESCEFAGRSIIANAAWVRTVSVIRSSGAKAGLEQGGGGFKMGKCFGSQFNSTYTPGTPSTMVYLRGLQYQDNEISECSSEDGSSLLDLDYSAITNDTGTHNIVFFGCATRGGRAGTSPSAPGYAYSIVTGTQRIGVWVFGGNSAEGEVYSGLYVGAGCKFAQWGGTHALEYVKGDGQWRVYNCRCPFTPTYIDATVDADWEDFESAVVYAGTGHLFDQIPQLPGLTASTVYNIGLIRTDTAYVPSGSMTISSFALPPNLLTQNLPGATQFHLRETGTVYQNCTISVHIRQPATSTDVTVFSETISSGTPVLAWELWTKTQASGTPLGGFVSVGGVRTELNGQVGGSYDTTQAGTVEIVVSGAGATPPYSPNLTESTLAF